MKVLTRLLKTSRPSFSWTGANTAHVQNIDRKQRSKIDEAKTHKMMKLRTITGLITDHCSSKKHLRSIEIYSEDTIRRLCHSAEEADSRISSERQHSPNHNLRGKAQKALLAEVQVKGHNETTTFFFLMWGSVFAEDTLSFISLMKPLNILKKKIFISYRV